MLANPLWQNLLSVKKTGENLPSLQVADGIRQRLNSSLNFELAIVKQRGIVFSSRKKLHNSQGKEVAPAKPLRDQNGDSISLPHSSFTSVQN